MKKILNKRYEKWMLENHRIFRIIALVCLVFLAFSAEITAASFTDNSNSSAIQELKISGVVTDSDGQSLPGVNIIEKGTTNGVITDFDGKFNITVSSKDAVLEFSFIGYLTETIPASQGSVINVVLVEDIQSLDEVVVVGYGVQKKSDVTGAMVSVSSDDLNERPVANALEALQGRAAGVDITTSERPGELGDIRIRGVRSLAGSKSDKMNDPLYVIDGVTVMSPSTIETLNPRDIESIDILKDASATAIYGSRGANGVIIVTTKKGKAGELNLNYAGTVTLENIVDKQPAMNASDYITWRRWAYHNASPNTYPRGDEPTLATDTKMFASSRDESSWENIQKGWEGGTWDGSKVTSTDWTDFVTQTGVTQEHSLSASGGTEKMQAYASFGYLDQQGTQIGQGYTRYTSKLTIDIQPKEWFKMGGSLNVSFSDQDYGMSELKGASSTSPKAIYSAAKRIYSYAVPYDENGDRILHPGGEENVYTIIDEWDKSTHQRETYRGIGSFYGLLDFGGINDILSGLTYRINFGPDFRSWREGVYLDDESAVRNSGTSYARLKNQRDFSWTLDNIISYNNTFFGVHNLGVTLLQTSSAWNTEDSGMDAYNIAKESYLWNAMGTVDLTDPAANASMWSGIKDRQLTSYMARLNYSFADKYLLTASGRWDGASQLSDGQKWAFFPSVALGWRLSQENFMQSFGNIDQLKLRFGVGSTGNSAVDPYGTLGPISSFFVPFGGQGNAQAYSPNEPNYDKDLNYMANKDLTWETTTQYNLGVDFAFYKGRIGGALDLYKSYTDDLLLDRTVQSITGYKKTVANIGKTKNKGIDITLTTVNILTKDFEWQTSLNAAWTKDEIVSLAYGKNDMVSDKWFIGESINVYYDLEYDRLWQESDSVLMNAYNDKGARFEAGFVKPNDPNNDTIIDEKDRSVVGNKNPRWTVGFNNTFTYKNFELNVSIYGRLGYTYSTKGEMQGGRYNQNQIDYWTPENTGAKYQKPVYSESGGDQYYSLIGYESGAYIKLRSISLGYNFSPTFLRKIKIKSMKLYVQGKNLGTIYSSIKTLDMDAKDPTSTFNRGVVFGISASF